MLLVGEAVKNLDWLSAHRPMTRAMRFISMQGEERS